MAKLTTEELNDGRKRRFSLLDGVYSGHKHGRAIISLNLNTVQGTAFLDYLWLIDYGYLVLLESSGTTYSVRISGKGIKRVEESEV